MSRPGSVTVLTRTATGVRRVAAALSRHVFEVYLFLLAGLAGAQGLSASSSDAAVESPLPGWMRVVWFGGLLLGSVAVLVGLMMPSPHSQHVEGAGLFILVGPAVAYALMLCAAGDWGQAAVLFAFAVALGVRIQYVRWEIRAVEAVGALRSRVDGEP